MTIQEVEDLRAEGAEAGALFRTLRAEDWSRPTPFKSWTPWDVVAHLHFSDKSAVASLRSRDDFNAFVAPFVAAMQSGQGLRGVTREQFGALDGPALLTTWENYFNEMCDRLAALDPKARLPWFGPDMGVRMFTTARLMETWAHSQDIYDLQAKPRVYGDRIKHIAVIGVRTFGWTFVNRKLTPPSPEPYVRLTAPSGEIWEFNEPSETDRVEGLASEFCHVVTQNRNVADTNLRVVGDSATRWMGIAQCFAGGPEDPPAPGSRTAR